MRINNDLTTKRVVIDNSKFITKIYHMADIHIRKYDRHEEYKEVFERLYNV